MTTQSYDRVFYHNEAIIVHGNWVWVPGPEPVYAKIVPDQGPGSFHVLGSSSPKPYPGNTISWARVTLQPGIYQLRVVYSKNRDHGIAELRFGDMVLWHIDQYASASQPGQEHTSQFEIRDVAMTADLIWTVIGKNAASSSYIAAFSLIEIVLISSGPGTPAILPCSQGTYVALGPAQTINGLQVQLLSINFLPAPGWTEIKLNGTGYDVGVGKTVTTQLGDLTLYALKDMGACFALPGISVPPPPPPPPPPLLSDCKFPELSWNLIEVLSQLVKWIGCLLNQVISLMGSVLASLAGIADYLTRLPDHLDEWVSRLFGIDPALPFFPELMRKIDEYISARLGVDPEKPLIDEILKRLVDWIFAPLNDASKRRIQERKW